MHGKIISKQKINSRKIAGFTLSEVLITLGILGVVASMSIPSLMNKAEKQSTIAGYQKSYSVLNQAVKMSEVDNGPIEYWDFPNTVSDNSQSLQFAQTYLVPYLSIAKKCELTTGCFIKPKRPDGNASGISSMVQYVLKDGMAMQLLNGGYSGIPTDSGKMVIYVDINGDKKPNTMGKDVFTFVLVPKAAPRYNYGDGELLRNVKTGGLYPDGLGFEITGSGFYEYRGCGKDVDYAHAGSYCGMKIIQDGYQIKDDYPW